MNETDTFDMLRQRLSERSQRITRLRNYAEGRPPLPVADGPTKAAWDTINKMLRTNTAELIVDSLAERIVPNGILIGDTADSEQAITARRIWRDNRCDVCIADAIRDCLITSSGYLIVDADEEGHATIRREKPEYIITDPDPLKPWRARSALRLWHDKTRGVDIARLYIPGECIEYQRDNKDNSLKVLEAPKKWRIVDTFDSPERIPVVILDNIDEHGEFEKHLGLIDRINWGIFQRMFTTTVQAFRQRGLKQDDPTSPLPDVDAEGNKIDYEKIFRPGPGALWELPPGISVWESQTTDINPMIQAVREDLRQLSAVTRTPVSMLIPEGANQSAEGAAAAREGLVFKAKDRISRFGPALNVLIVLALEIEGYTVNDTVEVTFEPPAMVSWNEKYQAAAQAKALGESLETIQRNILGYSPEQINQDKSRRFQEILDMAVRQNNMPNNTEKDSDDTIKDA